LGLYTEVVLSTLKYHRETESPDPLSIKMFEDESNLIKMPPEAPTESLNS